MRAEFLSTGSDPLSAAERHAPPPRIEAWLAAMLDEIDYPMLLATEGGEVLRANRTARGELCGSHPLRVEARRLVVGNRDEGTALLRALREAIVCGRRQMMRLGDPAGAGSVSLAVIPLLQAAEPERRAALLVLGRRRMCHALSMHWFAGAHGLSEGEAQVVAALCEGLKPNDIAKSRGVSLATVRTQIANARMKTGTPGIRELVQMVLVLPPMVHALGDSMRAH